jgi:large subunit ribosomal protein L4
MIEVTVKDTSASDVSKMTLNEENLGGSVRKKLLKMAVLMYEANQRQGTACTKRKSDKAGSTRKLYRQKGTGRARAGMLRSPTRRGGGKAFGPEPRDYSYDIGKKSRLMARKSALLSKLQSDKLMVLESLEITDNKTKSAVKLVKSLGLIGTVTFVPTAYNEKLHLAARNLPGVMVKPLPELSAYDLLRPKTVVIERAAVESLMGTSK